MDKESTLDVLITGVKPVNTRTGMGGGEEKKRVKRGYLLFSNSLIFYTPFFGPYF